MMSDDEYASTPPRAFGDKPPPYSVSAKVSCYGDTTPFWWSRLNSSAGSTSNQARVLAFTLSILKREARVVTIEWTSCEKMQKMSRNQQTDKDRGFIALKDRIITTANAEQRSGRSRRRLLDGVWLGKYYLDRDDTPEQTGSDAESES